MTGRPGPLRLPRSVSHDPHGGTRIERILGRPAGVPPVSALSHAWQDERGREWRAAWLDATQPAPVERTAGVTILHVLWTADGGACTVRAGDDLEDASGLMSFDATPGDTLTFAPRTSWQLGSGTLAFALAAPTGQDSGLRDGQVLPPTHGLPLFHRFNRRTVCSATPVAALERWKLTHPQRLTLADDRWHLLVNLVSPVAVGWPGGTDLVGRADLRLLPPGLPEITMVPDGLGYVLLAGVPVLEQEIIGALREAGYPNASIAALGVPPQALEA